MSTPDETFVCSECDKRFETQAKLNGHIGGAHSGNNDFWELIRRATEVAPAGVEVTVRAFKP